MAPTKNMVRSVNFRMKSTSAYDPEAVVRAHSIERLVPIKAVTALAGHVLLIASGSKPNGSFPHRRVSLMLHGDTAISLR